MSRRERMIWSVVLAALVAAGAGMGLAHQRARAAQGPLRDAIARRLRLEGLAMPPVPAEEARLDAELAAAREELALRRASLRQATHADGEPEPSGAPLDAVVRFARFVQEKRREVRESGVRARGDEAFGFAVPSARALDPKLLPGIEADRVVVDRLVTHLVAAAPSEILGVRRGVRAGAGSAPADRDGFVAAAGISLRRLGWQRVRSYQIEFLGTAATLGRLLRGLALDELPIMVTSVAVDSPPAVPAKDPPKTAAGASRRIVRFVLEAECIDLQGTDDNERAGT